MNSLYLAGEGDFGAERGLGILPAAIAKLGLADGEGGSWVFGS